MALAGAFGPLPTLLGPAGSFISSALCGNSCSGSPPARRGRAAVEPFAIGLSDHGGLPRVISLSVRVLSLTPISRAVVAAGESHKWLAVEVTLGDATQETAPRQVSAPPCGPGVPPRGRGQENCWRFGDELTFEARLEDLVGEGLHVRLAVHGDSSLGAIARALPLRLQLPGMGTTSGAALCEAEVDVRKYIVAACAGRPRRGHGHRGFAWESAPLLVPLVPRSGEPGIAGAEVALSFVVDADPEAILAALPAGPSATRRPLPLDCVVASVDRRAEEKFAGLGGSQTMNNVDRLASVLDSCLRLQLRPAISCSCDADAGGDTTLAGSRGYTAPWAEAEGDAAQLTGKPTPIKSPDLSPDGWVCREGPGGRMFWHHSALGPPPWERPFEEIGGQGQVQDATDQAALVRSMMGKVSNLRGARPVRQQRSRR